MNPFAAQFESVLAGVSIQSATRFSWFGAANPALKPHIEDTVSAAVLRAYTLGQLTDTLYRWFYCVGSAVRHGPATAFYADAGFGEHAEALARANRGAGPVAHGWRLRHAHRDEFELSRDGLTIWMPRAAGLAPATAEPLPGTEIPFRRRPGSRALSPGYYMAFGDIDLPSDYALPMVRLYWNTGPSGAVRLMRAATESLNRAGVAFRFKAMTRPQDFVRHDPAVLYLPRDAYDAALPSLREMLHAVRDELRPGVPALTKALAPGVALAEEPVDRGSYGRHRCALLSEALYRAFEAGEDAADARLAFVRQVFEAARLDVARPYLNHGGEDAYRTFAPTSRPRARAVNPAAESSGTEPLSAQRLLSVASGIGLGLCRDAFFHHGQCNWLGAENRPTARGLLTDHASLPANLYSGTSGVALFLAELDVATERSEPGLDRTVRAALAHALAQADDLIDAGRLGLYDGALGVALVADRVARLYRSDALLAAADRLVKRMVREAPVVEDFDIVSGKAGAVLGLLSLRDRQVGSEIDDLAAKLGRELIRTANVREHGVSWGSPERPAHRDLTGYSHGAAGAAHALLELFALTADDAFKTAAAAAIAYEDHWFDAAKGNWPDFRKLLNPADGQAEQSWNCLTFWCHGAPGIALSRLRANQLLDGQRYRDAARVAVAATQRACVSELGASGGNYSLCHGLCGNAEVVRLATQAGIAVADDARLPLWQRVAVAGARAIVDKGRPWPCGVGGDAPGLMIGTAGIGRFFLSLYGDALPSVLCFSPRLWASAMH